MACLTCVSLTLIPTVADAADPDPQTLERVAEQADTDTDSDADSMLHPLAGPQAEPEVEPQIAIHSEPATVEPATVEPAPIPLTEGPSRDFDLYAIAPRLHRTLDFAGIPDYRRPTFTPPPRARGWLAAGTAGMLAGAAITGVALATTASTNAVAEVALNPASDPLLAAGLGTILASYGASQLGMRQTKIHARDHMHRFFVTPRVGFHPTGFVVGVGFRL